MRGRLVAATLGALLGCGCLVQIDHHVADPNAAFREAKAEAARYQGRPGPAHEVNVLVYDPSEGDLVRVSVPLWLCKKFDGKVDFGDDGEDRAARAVRRHVRFSDLEKAGLGTLVEVEEDSGEQVLVWLR